MITTAHHPKNLPIRTVRAGIIEQSGHRPVFPWALFEIGNLTHSWVSRLTLVVKNPPANAGDLRDMGLKAGWERSPEGGNGSPLQYSCLESPWTEEPGGLQSMGSHRVGHV